MKEFGHCFSRNRSFQTRFFTTTSTSAKAAFPGVRTVRLHVPAWPGAKATAVVTWLAGVSTCVGSVDVDRDNKPDLAGTNAGGSLSKSFSLIAGRNGFEITLTTGGSSAARGTTTARAVDHSATLVVRLDLAASQRHCSFRAFGKACQGKITGVAVPGNGLLNTDIELAGGQPRAFAWLLIGAERQAGIRLPWGQCLLWVDFVIIEPGMTDLLGRTRWYLPIPLQSSSFSFGMQAATAVNTRFGLSVGTSHGLALECK